MSETAQVQGPTGVPPDPLRAGTAFVRLCEVIARLRSPEGCPWDRAQTMATIKPYTLEETYELLEAIDADDDAAIQEELGDVLLQVVLDAQIAADEGRFDVVAVVEQITRKMIDRHPHVFGDASAETADDVRTHWERAKQKEKRRDSLLDGIPADLPSLARAARLTKKAARAGYDFPHRAMLFDKLREEVDELRAELAPDGMLPEMAASVEGPVVPDERVKEADRQSRIEGELGDVLFVVANIARRWGVNPEEALRRANRKFSRRFQAIEAGLAEEGRTLEEATLAEMETHYQRAKRKETAENQAGSRSANQTPDHSSE
ncbi:MAG: nucleoside triphosphate pyrophosphohydrolase [Planctomycetota bacterium]|nr:MAG: nucleoside triphosphate pyrophosphohydrolase [Planctomycetota bacterium]REJ92260.1 MAG: nucleoside triphosphate pyrophosphohydrolase [Planctomycetota bacterium]REK29759.1 MAG: nucleoside triphosphate pyrophosphohydrolase [Planctomycetota bacterium]REK30420.1 MAG: nucleoside triphosphate pyrophosphohydrolase [Planctomycetota bacterium]